jgi:hypothetical protein
MFLFNYKYLFICLHLARHDPLRFPDQSFPANASADNVTAAGAVDRDFLFVRFPWNSLWGCHAPPLGSFCPSLVMPLVLFGAPWGALAPWDPWKILEGDCPE